MSAERVVLAIEKLAWFRYERHVAAIKSAQAYVSISEDLLAQPHPTVRDEEYSRGHVLAAERHLMELTKPPWEP